MQLGHWPRRPHQPHGRCSARRTGASPEGRGTRPCPRVRRTGRRLSPAPRTRGARFWSRACRAEDRASCRESTSVRLAAHHSGGGATQRCGIGGLRPSRGPVRMRILLRKPDVEPRPSPRASALARADALREHVLERAPHGLDGFAFGVRRRARGGRGARPRPGGWRRPCPRVARRSCPRRP